ncbi:DUF885 domain-containing protein [Sphingosinicella microcystinivorans]|uniref:Uncharacterized protein (DUF885 family) n=1 Tax=Sphingosinicella microcystinivorans TaxID=335406 RepID=A0AAD1G142_SPHMI|nr:DUF885 domain-containing protein [Sphingosinicella microcystinivorans]RKS91243.1 uncharacterized protein (DUF885 family) [Sphingosinicella microcystinivorans]BBE34211.1 hypothetical protein SmB9_18690 [Sphingosinicella microcystinivorans]
MTENGIDRLAAQFWDFQREEFPLTAIQAGQDPGTDMVLRDAPADHERRAAFAGDMLRELDEIDPASLGVQQKATAALLRHELRLLIDSVAVGAHLRPTLYPGGPDFLIAYWAGSTAIASAEEARRYLARLAKIPDAMAGVTASLKQGIERGIRYPKLAVERAAEQLRGFASIPVEASTYFGPLRRAANRSETLAALAEEGRTLIADTVYMAYRDYRAFIEGELMAAARESLACTEDKDGGEYYSLLIRQFASFEQDPQEIHELGLAEVARITRAMADVAKAANVADVAALRRQLQADNTQFAESGEALREQFEILSKRIDALIPEFFGRTPRTTYGISSIPEAVSAKLPPAYAQPNPADGSAAGVHWVTSMPTKCPRYMHIPLALHEAWPGHLMHIALIQEMEDLPAFRRYGADRYSACLEGWALYCEALGEEMGFYDTPQKIYGRLETEMWRAVRLVVDTGIHALGWSRERAIRYFEENMAMPMETVTAEVDRYIAMPAQALAYQLGNLKFREIRRRCEDTLGDDFRVRDFHDALMAAGPVTLPVLDDVMDEWIERVRN